MIRRTPTQHASRNTSRRASVTVEFLIAFPILIIATLAIFQYGMIALIQHDVNAAAIEGAREAAKLGCSTDNVAETVDDILSVYNIELDETAKPAAANQGDAHLDINDGSVGAALTETFGNASITCVPYGPGPTQTQVQVTVCLEIADVLPDLLATMGFSIANRTLTASSLATFE